MWRRVSFLAAQASLKGYSEARMPTIRDDTIFRYGPFCIRRRIEIARGRADAHLCIHFG